MNKASLATSAALAVALTIGMIGYGSGTAEAHGKPKCHVTVFQSPGRFGYRLWLCKVRIK